MKSPGAIARRAVRDRLADPATGWNAIIGPIAEDYGAPPIPLNFHGQSRNVENALRSPEEFDLSRMNGRLRLSIGAQESVEAAGGRTMAMFSGLTTVVLQFVYQERVSTASPDYDALVERSEYVADAVEDCCLRVLNDTSVIYPAMTPARAFQCVRGIAQPLEDGIQKGILVQLQFQVEQ
jgi:hypothetical protein